MLYCQVHKMSTVPMNINIQIVLERRYWLKVGNSASLDVAAFYVKIILRRADSERERLTPAPADNIHQFTDSCKPST